MKEKIVAVIPAYNEEKTIQKVIKEVKKHADEVIIVNDASKDNTAKLAQEVGAIVISNENNLGYDGSINQGFEKAKEIGATILFTFDADGQHEEKDLPKFLEPIKTREYHIVVGLRPSKPRFTEYIYAILSQSKLGVSDPLSGLKAYSIEAYNAIGYFDRLTSIGTELMFNCNKKGYKIKQVPITIKPRADESRFGLHLKGNYKIMKAVIKMTFYHLFDKNNQK